MTALAAAVAGRPRWEFDPLGDAAHLFTGTSYREAERPTGPWGLVLTAARFGRRRYQWKAFPAATNGFPLASGYASDPDAALDSAERVVDATVAR